MMVVMVCEGEYGADDDYVDCSNDSEWQWMIAKNDSDRERGWALCCEDAIDSGDNAMVSNNDSGDWWTGVFDLDLDTASLKFTQETLLFTRWKTIFLNDDDDEEDEVHEDHDAVIDENDDGEVLTVKATTITMTMKTLTMTIRWWHGRCTSLSSIHWIFLCSKISGCRNP